MYDKIIVIDFFYNQMKSILENLEEQRLLKHF